MRFIKLVLLCFCFVVSNGLRVYGQCATTVNGGNWSASGTWSTCGGSIPAAGTNVTIAHNTSTFNIASLSINTLNITGNRTITVNSPNVLTIANLNITGSNSLTITGTGTVNITSIANTNGTVNINDGATVNVTSSSTLTTFAFANTSGTGTLNVAGTVTATTLGLSGSSLTVNANSGGTITPTTLNLTSSTVNVNSGGRLNATTINASAGTINANTGGTFTATTLNVNNGTTTVNVNGTGTKTIGTVTINSDDIFVVGGTGILTVSTLLEIAGNDSGFNIGANATVRVDGEICANNVGGGNAGTIGTSGGNGGNLIVYSCFGTGGGCNGNGNIGNIISNNLDWCIICPSSNLGDAADCRELLLPVELVSFSAQMKQNKTLIAWETIFEKDINFFAVERSNNGVDFEEIARVQPRNTLHNRQQYEYVDNQLPYANHAFYRLLTKDTDGTFSYSKIESIRLSFDKPMIFPTDSEDGEINVVAQQIIRRVTYFNSLGETAYAKSLEISEQIERLTLKPNKTLPPGIYIVYVETITQGFYQKIRILR